MDRNFATGQTCQDVFVKCTLETIGSLAMSTTNAGATTATKSNTPADIHTQKSPQQQLPTHYFRIDELNASRFSQRFVACWTLGGLLGTRCVDTKKNNQNCVRFRSIPNCARLCIDKKECVRFVIYTTSTRFRVEQQKGLAFVSIGKMCSPAYRYNTVVVFVSIQQMS